jgi:hypothetical protein
MHSIVNLLQAWIKVHSWLFPDAPPAKPVQVWAGMFIIVLTQLIVYHSFAQ